MRNSSNPSELSTMPVVFVSHGPPIVALERNEYTRALRRMGEELPLPRAIVIVSAHWQAPAPLRVTGSEQPPMLYDFSGFPEDLHQVRYPCPGQPELAHEIAERLQAGGFEAQVDPKRGLDHGAWVPMVLAYPDAKIPVLELALTVPRTPSQLLTLGRVLRPLRERGILIVGSGGIVHNLRRMHWDNPRAPVVGWAHRFDEWVRTRLDAMDVPSLLAYSEMGPEANLAVPTTEHFDPVFVVLGAAKEEDRVAHIYEGIDYGSLSMRTFALRPVAG